MSGAGYVSGMAQALVGYATRSGSTRDVAQIIAEELREQGLSADLIDLAELPQAEGYDLLVIGSGIHGGQWFIEGLEWIRTHASVLEKTPTAVFNVCLNAADEAKRSEALDYNKQVVGGFTPISSESFAGRYTPAQVRGWQRLFMRAMRKRPVDLMDPGSIKHWARQLASHA